MTDSNLPFEEGISLIMATLGRSHEVGHMIESLCEQLDRRFELIIVDQNGDDRLVPYIEAGLQAGLIVRHERLSKRGLSHARNRGLTLARFPIVAFPDDDCWYEPEVIGAILNGFDQATVGGLVAHWVERGGPEHECGALSLAAWRNFRGGSGSSITLFIQRDILLRIGGFDESLGVGAWFGAAEETDLILRLLHSGAEISYCPLARVHHAYGTWVDLDLKRQCAQSRQRGRGTGALYAKHRIAPSVIVRGCLGPLLQPILRGQGWRAAVSGWVTVFGRLEGMLVWHLRQTR